MYSYLFVKIEMVDYDDFVIEKGEKFVPQIEVMAYYLLQEFGYGNVIWPREYRENGIVHPAWNDEQNRIGYQYISDNLELLHGSVDETSDNQEAKDYLTYMGIDYTNRSLFVRRNRYSERNTQTTLTNQTTNDDELLARQLQEREQQTTNDDELLARQLQEREEQIFHDENLALTLRERQEEEEEQARLSIPDEFPHNNQALSTRKKKRKKQRKEQRQIAKFSKKLQDQEWFGKRLVRGKVDEDEEESDKEYQPNPNPKQHKGMWDKIPQRKINPPLKQAKKLSPKQKMENPFNQNVS